MTCLIPNRNKSALTETEIAAGGSDRSFFPACLKSEEVALIVSVLVMSIF